MYVCKCMYIKGMYPYMKVYTKSLKFNFRRKKKIAERNHESSMQPSWPKKLVRKILQHLMSSYRLGKSILG